MIGYYIHHHGSGHLTRACQIAAATALPITGLSSLPRPDDWPGEWVQLPFDAEGESFADPTAGGVLHWAPLTHDGYQTRMERIASWITTHRPRLMVVDVSVEVSLLARLLGVPVAVMAMRGDRSDLPHRLAYDSAVALLAPWSAEFPEPEWPHPWREKTWHWGAMSRFDSRIGQPPPADPSSTSTQPSRRVSLLWGNGDEGISDNQLRRAEAATPGWEWQRATGTATEIRDQLAGADVVVSHAGQNAIAELAALRRPGIVVAADRPHGEQQATLAALLPLNVAVGISGWPADREWAGLFDQAVAIDPAGWQRWNDGQATLRAVNTLHALHTHTGLPAASGPAVITVVHGRHAHLRALIDGLARGSRTPALLVVVTMADPAAPHVAEQAVAAATWDSRPPRLVVVECPTETPGLPLAHARNLGAAHARAAGANGLIFLDVDCIASPHLVQRYAELLNNGAEAAVYAGMVSYLPPLPAGQSSYRYPELATLADPHPARPTVADGQVERATDYRLFWSLSFAMSTTTWDRVGGFCQSYVGYGGEDTDFAMLLQQSHCQLWWVGGAAAYHQHHPTVPHDQRVAHIVTNANLFHQRWGWFPMETWLAEFAAAGFAHYDKTSDQWCIGRETHPTETPISD